MQCAGEMYYMYYTGTGNYWRRKTVILQITKVKANIETTAKQYTLRTQNNTAGM